MLNEKTWKEWKDAGRDTRTSSVTGEESSTSSDIDTDTAA